MKRSSPTKPLGGSTIVSTKNVRTEFEPDGMPRRNICRSGRVADPTHSRALKLIAAEASKRFRRHRNRESVRNLQRDRLMAGNPVNEFALHTKDELRKEGR